MRANSDLVLVALVLGILFLLFAPIPPGLLDFLILTNFALALLILLLTFYAPRPVDFSTLPAVLLVATLFRLSLNVSATRLILTEGDAGRVIGAVGAYVVGGNYVIGLIVFLILVVVQYVVVTAGAQRVSEVAARFTLDSMPGQQMSIDADLNMGLIDQDEAKRRRRNLEREAGFYGAMDGASKFVKGDAIAGIVIMLINIVGGLVIGVIQHGMGWAESLQRYTLLTIGDGIVTQIPALVISVGTGLIVTRSASDTELGKEVLRQLLTRPRTLVLAAGTLLATAFLPGIPALPALAISTALGLGFWRARETSTPTNDNEADATTDDVKANALEFAPLEIQFGRGLSGLVGGEQGALAERVAAFRTQYAGDMGLHMPKVRFREVAELGEAHYQICIQGDPVAFGELQPARTLAIHPSGDQTLIPGIATRDPSYNLPALWIEDAQQVAARAARYTLVDPATVLFTHLCEVVRQQSASLLTRSETDRLLGRVRSASPGLVEELVPTVLTVSDVQKVLQNLLREKVAIRNVEAILEALVDAARQSKDSGTLTEAVRQRLGTTICNALSSDHKTLHVITVDPAIERLLVPGGHDAALPAVASDPRAAESFLLKLAGQAERMMKSSLLPVVLCSPDARRQIRALCERATPHVRVLSVAEIPPHYELRAFSTVSP
ncbi:flagellar biosynthesis protein FlhA [Niveibacterium sp. COAC-50]|uniref:flagellar biosynthesis protein FlhA n=1 Tax=Niveibacterium sp. COAC-50 TaxID=2729384 RepID=UPI001556CC11|nr:flagellar biosynthesis protein FlhA [Niveibacterium sp. COAC-50]